MKSKKNVLVSLSIFIVVVFVFTLFGQQKGPLWDKIAALEERVEELENSPIGIGPPDFESDWVDVLSEGTTYDFMHNLGGDPERYVVDIQFKDENGRLNNMYDGREIFWDNILQELTFYGGHWNNLDDTWIFITTWQRFNMVTEARVRIWKY